LAGRALAPRPAGVFLQLVRAVERRCIRRCIECRAYAVAVDRRAPLDETGDVVLGQPSAREDTDARAARAVEDAPHGPGERIEVAAVDAHRVDREPFGGEPIG